jgi:hypothetical protein
MENPPSLEQFAQMTAMVNAGDRSFDKMYAKFGIDESQWTQIAGHWMVRLGDDIALGQRFQQLVRAELARLNDSE